MKHDNSQNPLKLAHLAVRNSEQNFQPGPFSVRVLAFTLVIALSLAFTPSARAANLCVDQHGKPGCHTTINAAVAAANPGDTINVDPGTYREDVVIGKSLSLVGAGSANTTIDATALANGVDIDGFDNDGLSEVIVTGFTIANANFEGILVTNADAVTIFDDIVRGNDKGLQLSSSACPGQPVFETSEGNDCGEGIHLLSTTHSTVADNLVTQNSGGILLSDETATAHDNVITRNLVINNAYDCGITLASHPAFLKPGAPTVLAYGLYNNTISKNDSVHNGFGSPLGGSGVGIFAPGAGNRAYANQIVDNRLIGNALPGVSIHNHVLVSTSGNSNNPDVSRNAIINNYIAGNGSDPAAGTTVPTGISVLGVSPIVDLMISNNVIEDETIGVAFNSASTLEVHLNDFSSKIGVDNINPLGNINAREDWWGCTGGPGAHGCATAVGATGTVIFTPWLGRPMDGSLGHGFDLFFDLIHGYDFDHDKDCDFNLGNDNDHGFGFGH